VPYELLDFLPADGEEVNFGTKLYRVVTQANLDESSGKTLADCYMRRIRRAAGALVSDEGISVIASNFSPPLEELSALTGIPAGVIRGVDLLHSSELLGKCYGDSEALRAFYQPSIRNPFHAVILGFPDPLVSPDKAIETAIIFLQSRSRMEIRF
jgi:hypothetical protein